MNLRVLLLSLISNSCVNPSIAHGIKRMIPKSSVVRLYGIGNKFIRIMVAIPSQIHSFFNLFIVIDKFKQLIH